MMFMWLVASMAFLGAVPQPEIADLSLSGREALVIGITQNNVAVDSYQTTYDRALKETAQAWGVNVLLLDSEGDPQKQIAHVQNFIMQKVDVMIVWPTDGRAIVPSIRQAHRAGIPVVIANSQIDTRGSEYIRAFAGPNNVLQGADAAEMMCHALEGAGTVVELQGKPGYATAIERSKGFHQRLAEACPEVRVIASQPADWNREKAQRVMENFLIRHDNIDGVYAADDNMGIGALNAAKAAHRDSLVFIGATNFAVGYEAMARGEYHGSIYQSPVDDARNALDTALAVAQGRPIAKMNYFQTPKITPKNLSEFEPPVF